MIRPLTRLRGVVLPFLLAATVASAALAQTPAQDAAQAPAMELSDAQRQTIFQSVSRTQKNNPAPTGFRASVGAYVPAAIELQPVSDTLAQLVPQTRHYAVAMVEKQVMFVDPKTRQVVAVVTEHQ
jgi:endonuclease/exonuclease/phosphatase (EEP) superfamily protein YafD